MSWSRLLPSGHVNNINQDGVRYYSQLIDSLLAVNITPMVTLYHWDLPQPLMELGGWPNPLMTLYFMDYAKFAFKTFGDRVKMWITFNEPPQVSIINKSKWFEELSFFYLSIIFQYRDLFLMISYVMLISCIFLSTLINQL